MVKTTSQTTRLRHKKTIPEPINWLLPISPRKAMAKDPLITWTYKESTREMALFHSLITLDSRTRDLIFQGIDKQEGWVVEGRGLEESIALLAWLKLQVLGKPSVVLVALWQIKMRIPSIVILWIEEKVMLLITQPKGQTWLLWCGPGRAAPVMERVARSHCSIKASTLLRSARSSPIRRKPKPIRVLY